MTKSQLSVSKSLEYPFAESLPSHQQELKTQLLQERERTLNRNEPSVNKKLGGVKVKKLSPWWSGGNLVDMIAAVEEDVG